jgi:hypothetical protein
MLANVLEEHTASIFRVKEYSLQASSRVAMLVACMHAWMAYFGPLWFLPERSPAFHIFHWGPTLDSVQLFKFSVVVPH